ncbi:calmodulin calcium-dependent NAD kinase-like, partial [Silene latifolia]|uniref:calmodulin calcium-dependent NAD kinase-like n=1 Tax=Silene latifolia TaxID=37657 RepID=UPI003D789CC0
QLTLVVFSSESDEFDEPDCSNGKATLAQIFVASSLGLIIAAAAYYHQRNIKNQKLVPKIKFDSSKRVVKLERFADYVARQLGFPDKRQCPEICKLASDYINKREGFEENIYTFFSHEPDGDSLFIKLVEELERCILSYFAFHWNSADTALTQVLLGPEPEPKKKLKNILLAASREKRFERVTKNLKVARVFTTLVEEMKAIGLGQPKPEIDESECTDVMAPVALKDRSPVLLFMGGGMGAGKSTVLKDILIEPFWQEASGQAVVIEADAFKESDVIYRALSSRCHNDAVHTAELVHQSSTDAASSVLVTALNEGRDVIMDGTLSWLPFVVQTITMARNVHRKRYRMGPGYHVAADGTVIENYWEQVEDEEEEHVANKKRRPYRIELVGVVCDAYLSVIRGIRRAIYCRRGVRVRSQLKSHKRFANAFPTYCQLVDQARLYCTNALEGPPKLIGWKDRDKTLLVDPEEFKCLKMVGELNEEANNIYELYKSPNPACHDGSIWNDIVSSPSRLTVQQELKYSIMRIEGSK